VTVASAFPHQFPFGMSRVGPNHVVQFYESETCLCNAVGHFLHGGTVAVASAGIGQGATFTVCLPVRDRSSEASHGRQ
jgi:hypothetical protein